MQGFTTVHKGVHGCTRVYMGLQGYAMDYRPQFFKGWITLSTELITIQWIAWFVLSLLIYWIAIYPVDSVIQPLNNWGQEYKRDYMGV